MTINIKNSPVGEIGFCGANGKISEIFFLNHGSKFNSTQKDNSETSHNNLQNWLSEYFSGKNPAIKKLDLEFDCTEFQLSVYKELMKVEYGELVTYGDLAKRIGCKSAQAIGQAVGKNPIPIVVPCHRVIAANNSLGGFSSGLNNKIGLLELEGHEIDIERGLILR